MEKVREYLNKPLWTAVLGFVIGLIIGLPILGWWLVPVQWKDSPVYALKMDDKQDYLSMAIDSFAKNQNILLAKQRWAALGSDAQDVLNALTATPGKVAPTDVLSFKAAVAGTAAQPQPLGTTAPGTQTTPAAADTGGTSPVLLLVGLCLVLLVIGGVLAYLLLFRNKPGGVSNLLTPFRQAQQLNRQAEKTDFQQQGVEPPIAQFMTTYTLGIDLYDDSFSIDSPSGEFLGECGVGISDTIGVGDPKKVTAFEIWLFDKNDIKTETKVLMSEYAFNDPNISQKLASKAELVLIEAGKRILLETATLQLEARIVDMNYGAGALPTNSFMDRLTLELAIWQKQKA